MAEKYDELTIARKVKVTQQDIDDIMAVALDGGITWWCCKAEVYGDKYLGEFASDQISRGGSLILFDSESDDQWSLNKHSFLAGLKMYLEQSENAHEILDDDGGIDCCEVDATVADQIIQYALFKEIVFG